MNSSAIDQLRTAVTDGQVVVFAGAGVSLATTGGARTTSWRGLIEHGIEWCCHNSPAPKEEWESWMRAGLRGTLNQLLAVAEALTSALDAPRGDYAAWLRAAFCDLRVTDKATIEALVSLDLPIVTTNYDSLIAQVAGRQSITWKDVSTTHAAIRGEERGHVVHLHGLWSRPDTVILGIRDYEQILGHQPSQSMLRALQSLRSVLFVGFGAGLTDPNFSALRAWACDVLRDSPFRHFRLVESSKISEVEAQHQHDRITVIPFDKDGQDLGSFLRSLVPTRRTGARRGVKGRPNDEAVCILGEVRSRGNHPNCAAAGRR
jgi:SIR2-like protein